MRLQCAQGIRNLPENMRPPGQGGDAPERGNHIHLPKHDVSGAMPGEARMDVVALDEVSGLEVEEATAFLKSRMDAITVDLF